MDKKGMIISMISYYTDGNKAKFANKLGVTPQTISSWLSRDTFDLELIFAKCENINPEWLFTGDGQMLKSGSPNSLITHSGIFNGNNISSMVNSSIKGDGMNSAAITRKTDIKKSPIEKENIILKEENKHLKLQIELQDKIIEEKERFIQNLLERK